MQSQVERPKEPSAMLNWAPGILVTYTNNQNPPGQMPQNLPCDYYPAQFQLDCKLNTVQSCHMPCQLKHCIEEAGRFEQLCVLECFGFKQQMPIKGQTSVRCLLSGELPESGFEKSTRKVHTV